MYEKSNYSFRRIIAFSIYLLIAVLCLGKSIENVHANTPNNIFYVNGNVTASGTGTTADTAYKTLAEAYAAIPTENIETVIVICGPVDASNSGLKNSGSSYYLPEHSGKVILTSTYDNVDYSATANAGLNFNSKTFYLLGNTTFRNIHITGQADIIYADFYKLHFAKGITKAEGVTYTAKNVYAGTGNKMVSDTKFPKKNIAISDVALTIDSGDFYYVYGGGRESQASSTGHSVNITINGGTIGTLNGSGYYNSSYPGDTIHNDISIAINGGTITNLNGTRENTVVNGNVEVLFGANVNVTNLYAYAGNTDVVTGDEILTYKGTDSEILNATFSKGTRKFSVLKLQNSTLTVPNESGATTAWGAFNKVVLTDDSKLSLRLTPTNAVSVEVTKSGTDWQTTIPIITAPSGTVEGKFSLNSTTQGIALVCGTGENDMATWTLKLKETVLYVGGNGASDENAGTAEAPLASLTAAISAATEGTTITLLGDCTLSSSDYDKAITYDLNGHTLTADAFTGINATVVDSSNGEGLLKVLQDKLAFDSNNDGYMPVWDSKNAGYRFAKVTIEDRNEAIIEDALVFSMRPSFGSDTVEKLVAAGHETGMVRVGVRITWTDPDTQQEKTQDLPLNDSWLLTMYSNPSSPKGVKFTISGGKNITNFTATTIVWSNLSTCPNVEIAGITHTYSAEVE